MCEVWIKYQSNVHHKVTTEHVPISNICIWAHFIYINTNISYSKTKKKLKAWTKNALAAAH